NATSAAGMASVQFQLDGLSLGSTITGAGPTFSTSWNTASVSPGVHTLTATATDTLGQKTTSPGVTISLAAAPAINIVSPTGGNLSGTVTLTANATSTIGIATVQFQLDGTNIGPAMPGPGPMFSTSWNTASVSPGVHTLTATATDTLGQKTTSAGVSIQLAPAPSVTITNPTGGNLSGTVTLTANATSTVGIASVQFQLDGLNLGSTITGAGPTFSMPWNTASASNGTHTLTAIATDTLGQKTTSTGVTISLASAPSINIVSPTGGNLSGIVTLTANATSTAGIASVQFQLDGLNLGSAITGTGPTFSMSWNTASASNGTHTLTAIATDTLGQKTTATGVSISLASAPSINIVSPTRGNLSGTVTLTANATSTAGIASVQFQLDGSNLGSAITGTGPTFSMSWNTASASNGTHTLTAIATDTLGQKTTSTGVSISLASAPSINIVSPTRGNLSGTVTL